MKSSRAMVYLAANLAFATFVIAAYAISAGRGVHPVYLILLFAICTSSIFELKRLNGPYALLGIFSLNYFLFYGSLDITHLLSPDSVVYGSGGVASVSEYVILLGGSLVHIAYRIACRTKFATNSAPIKEWSELTLSVVGVALWGTFSLLNWYFSVHVVTDPSIQASMHGLASLSGLQITAFMIAHTAQPLGILIIAYAQCRFRRGYMMLLLAAVVLFQLMFGFVIDFKGEALLGGVLAVLTKLLVDGKVPKIWMAALFAFIVVGFPVLQANRVIVRGQYGANSTQVGQNIVESFARAFAGRDKVTSGRERSQTFAERLSLKASVETIVTKTGDITPFQHGYTLSPLITTFIPRLLWPDKPSIAVGRLMNKEFRVSDVADTFISPSHLGELYWNFGWTGVAVGMTVIGLLLGYLGARFDLSTAVTMTRVMVIVVTIRLMILGSEGEIATQYVLWIRSMAAIGILHWCFARWPIRAEISSRKPAAGTIRRSPGGPSAAPFPNLLR